MSLIHKITTLNYNLLVYHIRWYDNIFTRERSTLESDCLTFIFLTIDLVRVHFCSDQKQCQQSKCYCCLTHYYHCIGSKTGIFLRDVGALKYGEQAATRVNEVWLQAYG